MARPSANPTNDWAQLSPGAELKAIANRAQEVTSASGAAIALMENDPGHVVCYARSGSIAPDVGATLSAEGSLPGLCVQSGQQIWCDDVEADTRAHVVALRTIGIRSLVVTPVRQDGKVRGVLAVFADTRNAFSGVHLARLQYAADQITALLDEAPIAGREQPKVQFRRTSTIGPDVSKPKPPASAAVALHGKDVKQPVVQSDLHVAAVPVVEVHDSPAGPRQKHKKDSGLVLAGIVAVLVMAGSAGWSVLKIRQMAQVTPAASAGSRNAASVAIANPQSEEASKPANAPVVNSLGSQIEQPATSTNLGPPGGSTAASPPGVARSAARAADALADAPPKAPAGSGIPAATAGSPPSAANIESAANSAHAAKPMTLPPLNFVPAQLVHVVSPVYPALDNPITGSVSIRFTVGKDGKVIAPAILSGLGVFQHPALDAVSQWRYKPASSNGVPVEQQLEVSLDFDAGNSPVPPDAAPANKKPAQSPALERGNGSTDAGLPAKVEPSFLPAQLVSRVQPVYPALARQWLTVGTVVIRFRVDREGRVTNPEVVKGPMVFRRAALDAVKQWQYKPALSNGQPGEQQMEVQLDFRPQPAL